MDERRMESERETSLGKALRLLFAVGESGDPSGVSIAELLRITGLSRPTAYRFLSELQEFGLVTAVPKRPMWQLGPKIIALAAMAGNWATLRRRVKEAMDGFVREVGHTINLGIRDGFEIVYVDKAESPDRMTLSSAIGQRRPLNVTALGKCLVAFDADPKLAQAVADAGLPGRTPHSITDPARWLKEIETVREAGYALDQEECELGARCVAAPIRDASGYGVAAISITVAARCEEAEFEALIQRIRQTAGQIGLAEDLPRR